jgi:hypothetical protein
MFRDMFREAGFEARRGQQFSGGTDSPDVVVPALPDFHWEIKYLPGGQNQRLDGPSRP